MGFSKIVQFQCRSGCSLSLLNVCGFLFPSLKRKSVVFGFYPLLYPLYLYNVKPSFHQSSIVGMLTPFLCRKTLTKE